MKFALALALALPLFSQVGPFQGGTGTIPRSTLPTTCVRGSIQFLTTAPAGLNLYGCTAANTWSAQGATGAVSFASLLSGTNTTGALLCGTGCTFGVTGGGVVSATTAVTITGALALANTPLTTLGDLLVVTSGPMFGRIAKGTQYQSLQGGVSEPGWDALHLDQSSATSGILGGLKGGTGNGFFAIAGPASSLKTHTWPNASIDFTALTGVGKWAAGVPSVVSGTSSNCVLVDGTSGACGSGDPADYTTVTFSATPAFAAASSVGTSFLLTLTGDVSSSTLTGASTGQFITLNICQDGTGNRVFNFPSNVLNAGGVDLTASACTHQVFVYDGADAQALAPAYVTGVSGGSLRIPGSTSGSTVLKASAVATGELTLPAVSTTDTLMAKATTDVMTNKTFDTASNTFRINATNITAVSGTGAVCLASGSACAGGGVPATGGGYWIWGAPYSSNGGVGYTPAPPGLGANSGNSFSFYTLGTFSFTNLNFFVTTAGNGAKAVRFAVYNAALTSALCISAIGTGTVMSATGAQTLTMTSGPNVSGGVCTLPPGGYRFVETSDDTTYQIMGYSENTLTTILSKNGATRAGFVAAVSTGSGGSLAFVADLSGLAWGAFAGNYTGVLPAILLDY